MQEAIVDRSVGTGIEGVLTIACSAIPFGKKAATNALSGVGFNPLKLIGGGLSPCRTVLPAHTRSVAQSFIKMALRRGAIRRVAPRPLHIEFDSIL